MNSQGESANSDAWTVPWQQRFPVGPSTYPHPFPTSRLNKYLTKARVQRRHSSAGGPGCAREPGEPQCACCSCATGCARVGPGPGGGIKGIIRTGGSRPRQERSTKCGTSGCCSGARAPGDRTRYVVAAAAAAASATASAVAATPAATINCGTLTGVGDCRLKRAGLRGRGTVDRQVALLKTQ